ncbi:MAG: preprotein translocase subunit SecE [Candidatus Omnitrophota bacterium]
MKIFEKPINFIKEVKIELSKVSWSTRQELTASTLVVISVTCVTGIFIGLIDLLLSKGLSILFK